MHVASYNTAAATELCIRTARRLAGIPFAFTVGDGGSTDKSLPMLRRLAARGAIDLDVEPGGRTHAQWLDHWYATCTERYCVFSDSDVDYRAEGWLRDMVSAARNSGAALVATRIQARDGVAYQHPTTGARRTLAPRPEPWLVLIDLEQTRPHVHTSFGYVDRVQPDGSKTAYDVAAAFFAALAESPLAWIEMPPAFATAYHHFGGLSWQQAFARGVPLRRRAKQLTKRADVWLRLERARLLDLRSNKP
ncbi:MAG TPA: glycosyltransferase [Acidimicrobiia bacterium]